MQARIKVDGAGDRAHGIVLPPAAEVRGEGDPEGRNASCVSRNWKQFSESYRGPGTAINRLLVLGLSVQDVLGSAR